MQTTANTNTIYRIIAAARAAMAARHIQECYSIHVAGVGQIGEYATISEAENALHLLPYCTRQQATIYDQDGYCVVR